MGLPWLVEFPKRSRRAYLSSAVGLSGITMVGVCVHALICFPATPNHHHVDVHVWLSQVVIMMMPGFLTLCSWAEVVDYLLPSSHQSMTRCACVYGKSWANHHEDWITCTTWMKGFMVCKSNWIALRNNNFEKFAKMQAVIYMSSNWTWVLGASDESANASSDIEGYESWTCFTDVSRFHSFASTHPCTQAFLQQNVCTSSFDLLISRKFSKSMSGNPPCSTCPANL